MTTDGQTAELVAKVRELLACKCVTEPYQECGVHGDDWARTTWALADALEAQSGVRVDMSSAVGVETQLAAGRSPTQGEASDDQYIPGSSTLVHYDADGKPMGRCVLLADIECAGFTRAAAPEPAAIERVNALAQFGVESDDGSTMWVLDADDVFAALGLPVEGGVTQ